MILILATYVDGLNLRERQPLMVGKSKLIFNNLIGVVPSICFETIVLIVIELLGYTIRAHSGWIHSKQHPNYNSTLHH